MLPAPERASHGTPPFLSVRRAGQRMVSRYTNGNDKIASECHSRRQFLWRFRTTRSVIGGAQYPLQLHANRHLAKTLCCRRNRGRDFREQGGEKWVSQQSNVGLGSHKVKSNAPFVLTHIVASNNSMWHAGLRRKTEGPSTAAGIDSGPDPRSR